MDGVKRGGSLLCGREVSLTGRFASMSRDEAKDRIRECGGRYVDTPHDTTDLLVVGLEGWPLSSDGRLTKSLEHAHAMQAQGLGITIATEEEFLSTLGLEDLQVGTRRVYTIGQLAHILDIPIARIRAWLRSNLIHPVKEVRRLCWFDFRQVANVRALERLQESGATPDRIRRSLEQLRTCLPGFEIPLTQLEAFEDGLVVRLDDGRIAEPTGQLRLDFEATRAQRTAVPMTIPTSRPKNPSTAEDWFQQGVAAEEEDSLEDAVAFYMNSLLAGGPQAETCFNLGNALYGLGRYGEAMQRYLQSIEIDPDYVEAWNNLGNSLAELGRLDEAVNAYEQTLLIEPDYADTHCNLAEVFEDLDRANDARCYSAGR